MFRANADDPHPMPWIRVKLSCAIGDAFYPHPQWRELAALWESLYPRTELDAEQQQHLAVLEATFPHFVALLVDHRPPSLHGRSLREVMPLAEREPQRLAWLWRSFRDGHRRLRDLAPSLAFAVLGQARAVGDLSPETESRPVESLLTYWALRSTLDVSGPQPNSGPPGSPAASSAARAARSSRSQHEQLDKEEAMPITITPSNQRWKSATRSACAWQATSDEPADVGHLGGGRQGRRSAGER